MTRYELRTKRQKRVRKNVSGSDSKPRLAVFRSNKHIYVQAIDDVRGVTIASASDAQIKKGKPIEKAREVGETVGKLIQKTGVDSVVFDRGGYKFHGRVKSLAEGARSTGLKF